VATVQECGLKFRHARRVVAIVLDSMVKRLKRGDEVTVKALGIFTVAAVRNSARASAWEDSRRYAAVPQGRARHRSGAYATQRDSQ
jgi:nucleoid DNA-binding protein